jgi:hypothetical protein
LCSWWRWRSCASAGAPPKDNVGKQALRWPARRRSRLSRSMAQRNCHHLKTQQDAIRQSLWSGVEKALRSSTLRRMMVGLAACIAASSIACAWRRCAPRSRARLELQASSDTSHTQASVALLIAAKTEVDPDRAFCGLPISIAVAARRGAKIHQPAVWQRCNLTNLARVNWISNVLRGTPPRPASQLLENVDITGVPQRRRSPVGEGPTQGGCWLNL